MATKATRLTPKQQTVLGKIAQAQIRMYNNTTDEWVYRRNVNFSDTLTRKAITALWATGMLITNDEAVVRGEFFSMNATEFALTEQGWNKAVELKFVDAVPTWYLEDLNPQHPAPTAPDATSAAQDTQAADGQAVVTERKPLAVCFYCEKRIDTNAVACEECEGLVALHRFLSTRRNATYAEMCAELHNEGVMYDTVSQAIKTLVERGKIELDGTVWEHDGFIETWRVVPATQAQAQHADSERGDAADAPVKCAHGIRVPYCAECYSKTLEGEAIGNDYRANKLLAEHQERQLKKRVQHMIDNALSFEDLSLMLASKVDFETMTKIKATRRKEMDTQARELADALAANGKLRAVIADSARLVDSVIFKCSQGEVRSVLAEAISVLRLSLKEGTNANDNR